MSFSIINQNKTICFNRSVENFEDFLNFEVLQNNTKSTFVIKIHTTMYNGKARNAIIQYELKLDYEGNYVICNFFRKSFSREDINKVILS